MKQKTRKAGQREHTRKGPLERFERQPEPAKYTLRLYIAGTTPRSSRAVMNIKEICETSLRNRYNLEVIDIYQQPVLAKGQQIIAVPTLIKELPPPLRRFIGDMSNTAKILVGLDLQFNAKP